MTLHVKTRYYWSLLLLLLALLVLYFGHAITRDEQPYAAEVEDSRATLRVLTWAGTQRYLPRSGTPQDIDLSYLKQFSKQHNLIMQPIYVANVEQLIPKLLAGEGDVISANFTITPERSKKVRFSLPFLQGKEYLLMGKNSPSLKNGASLSGRELILQRGTSYQISSLGLKKVYPQLTLRYIDNAISDEDIYDRLASGEYDLAIQDNNLIEVALSYRDDIKKSLQASSLRDIAWAVSPENPALLAQLNQFLQQQSLALEVQNNTPSQWQKIVSNNTVRFVLRNNLASYYIWRGELLGFHYELAKQFASEHKLRYEIIVAPDNVALIDYLIEDKADIALGFLTPTAAREAKGIRFSRPYHYASELLVAASSTAPPSEIAQLEEGAIVVRKSSAYWSSALRLQQQAQQLTLRAAPESQETESIIADVAAHAYPYTIADSHIVDIELLYRDNVHSLMSLGEPKAQSWALKAGNDALLDKVDSFIKKHYKGLFYNVIYNKYFKDSKRLAQHYSDYEELKRTGILSPYDALVKKYAQTYQFDWRLLVAQMHQESRFDPQATSVMGAKGLFQIMPRTAEELGVSDVHDPEQGIEAGVRYMDWVRARMLSDGVQDDQLLWFTLASYNAGAGHVRDAMHLAKQKGWRSDLWFDHVEKAMLLLSQSKYAAKARYGYVRGQEPVTYIREIKRRYESYQNIVINK